MRILIIEDQEKLAKSIKKGLEQEGFAADFVTDGNIGQRRIEAKPRDYDAAVLDVMLPGKSGLEVCRAWREQKITIPVLMLTAKDALADKVTGLDIGADDYLVKPFSFEELLARLRALMRRPRETLPAELAVGQLLLNPATKKVLYKNKEIELTLKEFSLLEYLMRHPGVVLSREQILEHAWDFAYTSLTNVVDVHIKNIRKKLGQSNGKPLETVRGLGYRLTA